MSKFGLFGGRSVDAVALVEQPVSQSYARKARVAFFVTAIAVGLLSSALLAAVGNVARAVAFGVLVGLAAGVVVWVLVRVWPVLRAIWWWSAEIATVAVVVGGSSLLARVTVPLIAVALLLVATGAITLVPRVRRSVTAWAWCAVVRHRLRLAFAEVIRSGNRSRPGLLPLILFARPTPAGERVWLWLRPGLSLEQLEGKAGELAVACLANQVRLLRASDRYAALLRVDVSRRDPLTGVIGSPLVDLLRGWADEPAPVSPAVPPVGLNLADVPDEFPDPPRSGRR